MTKKLTFIFSMILSGLLTVVILINIGSQIRWDKVPVIKYFVLQINLYPADFDAQYLDEPIKWYELDEEPEDFEGNGYGRWFAINPYTKRMLKNYMRENNLGIVPDEWIDLQITSNFEECLEIFEFVELSEEERTPISRISTLEFLLIIFSILSVTSWMLYFIFKYRC